MMDARVAILSLVTLALLLQPSGDDAPDDQPLPFIGEIGASPLFILIGAIVVAVFAIDAARTWWQTNEWRRGHRQQPPR
jgi:hypothetical protein